MKMILRLFALAVATAGIGLSCPPALADTGYQPTVPDYSYTAPPSLEGVEQGGSWGCSSYVTDGQGNCIPVYLAPMHAADWWALATYLLGWFIPLIMLFMVLMVVG